MKIVLLTTVGEIDSATLVNGQGSFAAALASSMNIRTAVDEINKGEITAKKLTWN